MFGTLDDAQLVSDDSVARNVLRVKRKASHTSLEHIKAKRSVLSRQAPYISHNHVGSLWSVVHGVRSSGVRKKAAYIDQLVTITKFLDL